jgi:hypothetical protein
MKINTNVTTTTTTKGGAPKVKKVKEFKANITSEPLTQAHKAVLDTQKITDMPSEHAYQGTKRKGPIWPKRMTSGERPGVLGCVI